MSLLLYIKKLINQLSKVHVLKTIYYNFRLFPINIAVKFPLIIGLHTTLKHFTRKSIIYPKNIRTASILLGIKLVEFPTNHTIIDNDGIIKINGTVRIGSGTYLLIGSKGFLEVGDNFEIKANGKIIAVNQISIGDNCLVSWDVSIMDTDWHKIRNKHGVILNPNKPIILNDHIWIGMGTTILKGTTIESDNIIAANSTIVGNHYCKNSILSSNKTLRTEINWVK